MKKLLLSLGTVAAIAAPVASVIACGHTATPKAKTTVKTIAALTAGTQLQTRTAPGDDETTVPDAALKTKFDAEFAKLTFVGEGVNLTPQNNDERYYFTGTSSLLESLSSETPDARETYVENTAHYGIDASIKYTYILEKYEFVSDASAWATKVKAGAKTTNVAYALGVFVDGTGLKSIAAWIK